MLRKKVRKVKAYFSPVGILSRLLKSLVLIVTDHDRLASSVDSRAVGKVR